MRISGREKRTYRQTVKTLNFELILSIQQIGDDLLGILKGPNAHLGAVSLSQPYKKKDRSNPSASVSTLSQHGHRDSEITKVAAHRLSRSLNCPVIVTGGLHVDGLTKEGITFIFEALDKLLSQAIADLQGS